MRGNHDLEFTSFPNDVLRHMVSFLPLEQAVRTSILSSRWRAIWLPEQFTTEEVEEIAAMLLGPAAVHQIWKLCFLTGDETVHILARKGVNGEVRLEFEEMQEEMTSFRLKLEPEVLAGGFSSSVRTLHLRSVNNLGKDFSSTLFSRCQFLESLKLQHCRGLQILDLEANDCFRSLEVSDCPEMENITISARNLHFFSYQGVTPLIQLKNTSKLVEVSLNFDGLGENREFDSEDVVALLASLEEMQILTIKGWFLECLCSAGVIFRWLEFKLNKLKELYWIDSHMNKRNRDSLACFLNICPSLEKLHIKIDPSRNRVPCPFFHHYLHEPHLWMDNATVECNTSELKHLKMVEVLGYTGEEDQLLLMNLLFKKGDKLDSITVTSRENRSWQVAKTPQSQLKQTWNWNDDNKESKKSFLSLLMEDFLGFLYPAKAELCYNTFWF
ncbi:hypothetical protein SLEP1_g38921 [Rubroshorea leprosula]|uniref:F-box domain-containing protein n=1 Tax=Rubroshorea leprosula TaxID=152421 RepID=A0AAV5KZA6_9ROSI|nr:hypothetical protein SLEP1_g38921 [Rubroshorea leprosula]